MYSRSYRRGKDFCRSFLTFVLGYGGLRLIIWKLGKQAVVSYRLSQERAHPRLLQRTAFDRLVHETLPSRDQRLLDLALPGLERGLVRL